MDHNREASQHLTSFLQLFFWSVRLGGSLSLHSVLCKFLTPENSPYISNIPDRVLTVPHIMYVYITVSVTQKRPVENVVDLHDIRLED